MGSSNFIATFLVLIFSVALFAEDFLIAIFMVWAGVFIGVTIMLSWSFVEIVVLTPAFEILFASLYILERNKALKEEKIFKQAISI